MNIINSPDLTRKSWKILMMSETMNHLFVFVHPNSARVNCENHPKITYIYIIWDRKPEAFERLDMFGGDWTRGCGYMYRFEHFMSPIFMTRLRGKLFLAKDHGWRPRWCWLQPVHALNAMDKLLIERPRTKTHHGGYGLDLTPTRQQWQMKV